MEPKQALLELHSKDPASPRRVAEIARFLREVLDEVRPGELPDEFVTVVITNYSLKASVRPRMEAGYEALEFLSSIIEDPSDAQARLTHSDDLGKWLNVARELKQFRHSLFQEPVHVIKDGREIRILDKEFSKLLSHLVREAEDSIATKQSGSRVHGTTTIYTKILKVGRNDDVETAPLLARMVVQGQTVEVPVSNGITNSATDLLFDIARARTWARVKLRTSWDLGESPPRILTSESCVLDVARWEPADGARAIEMLHAAAPSLTARAEEVIDELNRERRLGGD